MQWGRDVTETPKLESEILKRFCTS